MTRGSWKAASKDLRRLADPAQARNLMRFFKTGPGQYGEGDRFLGLKVPQVRELAKNYFSLSWADLDRLIRSPIHEERLFALVILTWRAQKAETEVEKRVCYRFYVDHMRWINNWDLVDLTAPQVVGAYLSDKPKGILFRWAVSKRLWDRRVAVLSTFSFIREHRFTETLRLARMLLGDREDLMHKAVGWMLREVGKRDEGALRRFLDAHAPRMPRTMLRYALEKKPDGVRRAYLAL